MKMRVNQKGFTLIELVVVIVILGILAATALPKFVDLSGEAGDAAAQGVAGALASATSINYAKRLASSGGSGTPIIATTTCSALDALMVGGVLSSDGKVTWVTPAAPLAGCTAAGLVDTASCEVKHASGTKSFKVTVICAGA
jgi:MSHA pilin protein MshA